MKVVNTKYYFEYIQQHPNFTGYILDGDEIWYRDGRWHREDGPAVIRVDGSYILWYIDGEELTEEEFKTWQRTQKLEKFLNDDENC